MLEEPAVRELIRRCVQEAVGDQPQDLQIEQKRLSGGLEAAEVVLFTARYKDTAGRPRVFRLVCKQLSGRTAREAAVYERLTAMHAIDISPQLIAVERVAPDQVILCLEAVRRVGAWPWQDMCVGGVLLARLALFHNSARHSTAELPEWDYDSELRTMAETTWTALDRCRLHPELASLARGLAPLRRFVLALATIRRQLFADELGCGTIHGDVHPGNALVRRCGSGKEPVLIDWGRARIGSPLEDVSSWLQSLGYSEVSARTHHDKLLMGYLSALGRERKLTSGIRAAYWIAGASNGLAGALLHHLWIAQDERQSERRRTLAIRAARDWLRVIRRADAWSG